VTAMSILDTITAHKKIEVSKRKQAKTIDSLQESSFYTRKPLSLKDFLTDKRKNGIIAEFKRKSPSKGIINDKVNIKEVVTGYEKAGASAVSVLTDTDFFGGTDNDIMEIRNSIGIPVLRKEFIIDEYQVYESKSIGADVILLIAAILIKDQAFNLARLAHSIGLQVLMEFHDDNEIGIMNEYVDVAGINNRNLKTFEVSLEHSAELASRLPQGILKISESGISSPDDIIFLKKYGFDGFLIGENFMKAEMPARAFADFASAIKTMV